MFRKKFNQVIIFGCIFLSSLVLVACGEQDTQEETQVSSQIEAQAGGSITLPEGFAASEEVGTLVTQLVDKSLYGAFNKINSKNTKYFSHSGSITVTIQGKSSQENTKWTDAFMHLWKKGDNTTEFIQVVHFKLDGTPYTYTFSDLDPSAQYRISITYNDVPKYKMTGSFVINGITSENESI